MDVLSATSVLYREREREREKTCGGLGGVTRSQT